MDSLASRERDALELKAWMRTRMEEDGRTRNELAALFGVSTKTISNAVSPIHGFPNGLTTYRLLRELGGISAEGPPQSETVAARLDRIEQLLRSTLEERDAVAVLERAAESVSGLSGQQEPHRSRPPTR